MPRGKSKSKKGGKAKAALTAKQPRADDGKFVKSAEKLENQDQVILSAGRAGVAAGPDQDVLARGGAAPPNPRNHQQTAEQYPTKFLSQAEEQDRLNRLKYQLAQATAGAGPVTGITPYGKLQWSDDIGHWLLRKEEAAKKAQFQQWFASNYDKWGPAQKKIARELYPQFYAERMKTMEENLELAKKVARVRLRGVESAEDLALQFAADKGLIDMSVLNNIVHPENSQSNAYMRVAFRRGLFNSNTRFLGQTNNASDFASEAIGENIPDNNVYVNNTFIPGAGAAPGNTNIAVLNAMGFV